MLSYPVEFTNLFFLLIKNILTWVATKSTATIYTLSAVMIPLGAGQNMPRWAMW